MLFEKFLRTISEHLGDPLSGREDELTRLNPDKFYAENVRSLLDVSAGAAQQICETAVRQGLFRRGIELLCPDGSVAKTADTEAQLPPTVSCWVERDGDLEEQHFNKTDLRRLTFYRLIDTDRGDTDRATA